MRWDRWTVKVACAAFLLGVAVGTALTLTELWQEILWLLP